MREKTKAAGGGRYGRRVAGETAAWIAQALIALAGGLLLLLGRPLPGLIALAGGLGALFYLGSGRRDRRRRPGAPCTTRRSRP